MRLPYLRWNLFTALVRSGPGDPCYAQGGAVAHFRLRGGLGQWAVEIFPFFLQRRLSQTWRGLLRTRGQLGLGRPKVGHLRLEGPQSTKRDLNRIDSVDRIAHVPVIFPWLRPCPEHEGGKQKCAATTHSPGNGGGSGGACPRNFWQTGATPPQLRCRNVLNTYMLYQISIDYTLENYIPSICNETT